MDIQLLKRTSFFKTLYFNFRYFSFKEALRFPVIISKNVYLRRVKGKITIEAPLRPGLIKIGFGNVGIFDDKKFRAIWFVSGEVIFKGRANIGYGSKIDVAPSGKLIIGDNLSITAASSIISHKNIEFGANCIISWEVLIMDTDLHIIKDTEGLVQNAPQDITINEGVWIGCRCLILKGAHVPAHTVIAANSVVTKKLNDTYALYAGIPVKKIKDGITWQQ